MAKFFSFESVVMIDCDDTLIMHDIDGDKIEFVNPYTKECCFLVVHKQHVELVKRYKGRGYGVIVWSADGAEWAQEVVDRLALNDYVDIVMSKPIKYVDDLPANEILGTRVYIPYDGPKRAIIPGETE